MPLPANIGRLWRAVHAAESVPRVKSFPVRSTGSEGLVTEKPSLSCWIRVTVSWGNSWWSPFWLKTSLTRQGCTLWSRWTFLTWWLRWVGSGRWVQAQGWWVDGDLKESMATRSSWKQVFCSFHFYLAGRPQHQKSSRLWWRRSKAFQSRFLTSQGRKCQIEVAHHFCVECLFIVVYVFNMYLELATE